MSLRSAILSVKAQRKSHTRHDYSLFDPLPVLPSLILTLIYLFSPPIRIRSDHDHRAKRYERLMKFHGIHQSQSGGTVAPTMRDIPVASRRKASPSEGPIKKKRKVDKLAGSTDTLNTDDDEGLTSVKTEPVPDIKAEPKSIKQEQIKEEQIKEEQIKEEHIKEEPNATENLSDSKTCTVSNGATVFNGAVDSAMFDDFLAFGGSFNHLHGFHAESDLGVSGEGSASMSVESATQTGNGQGLHESILIAD